MFNPIGAICLQETWTSESDDISLYEIPNYNLFHRGKLCCNHGGLFIYVHNIFKAEPTHFDFSCTNWEGYCVKLTQSQPYTKHYTIANVIVHLMMVLTNLLYFMKNLLIF